MSELPTNSEIENAAIACVIAREHAAGRQAVDVRYRGEPADIRSPPRHIEVKAYGTTVRGYELWLEAGQVEEARQNPEFYVYVVENVRQGDHRFVHTQGAWQPASAAASPASQGTARLDSRLAGRRL